MSEKFNGKYRIASARLKNWNYGNNGRYFITICTQNRKRYFGEIAEQTMHLSEIGQLAHQFWAEIPEHFPFVELGEFIVMPDHVHGILIIDRDDDDDDDDVVETLQCNVSTINKRNVSTTKSQRMADISPKSGTISTIIRSYKSVVTRNARKINPEFAWQARFYDHIIRDDQAFRRISNYTKNNPIYWGR